MWLVTRSALLIFYTVYKTKAYTIFRREGCFNSQQWIFWFKINFCYHFLEEVEHDYFAALGYTPYKGVYPNL